MSKPKHTPGPWRWEYSPIRKHLELVGGVPKYDLTVMDFVRHGMSGAIARFRDLSFVNMNVMEKADRWAVAEPDRKHHADWHRLINHPDARLIEAAPDLLAALRAMVEYQESTDLDDEPEDGEYGDGKRALLAARAAIAKATGS